MRAYESLVILDPTAEEADCEKLITRVEESIVTGGGVHDSTDRWGKRRLAYEIKKQREGVYVLINFKGPATYLADLDKLYRFSPIVMRAMTTLALPEQYRKKPLREEAKA